MKSNLFFDGPVRTGKSTAVRHALLPYLTNLGGFVVQRLLNPDGTPVAYRLVGMDEIRQAGKDAEATFMAVDAPYPVAETEALSNIFLRLSPRSFDVNIFATYGMECLRTSNKIKLILLDEIGGVDLLSLQFRERLLATLDGSIPCIGVIKEIEKARDAQSFNRDLRAHLNIQPFSSDDLSKVSSQINCFLQSHGI